MTEPRNQYWRRIVPVVGEPIPDWAEFAVTVWGYSDNWTSWESWKAKGLFESHHTKLEWRVPVPVVPLSVAVELLKKCMMDGFRATVGAEWRDVDCRFDTLVTDKLIELAEQRCAGNQYSTGRCCAQRICYEHTRTVEGFSRWTGRAVCDKGGNSDNCFGQELSKRNGGQRDTTGIGSGADCRVG